MLLLAMECNVEAALQAVSDGKKQRISGCRMQRILSARQTKPMAKNQLFH